MSDVPPQPPGPPPPPEGSTPPYTGQWNPQAGPPPQQYGPPPGWQQGPPPGWAPQYGAPAAPRPSFLRSTPGRVLAALGLAVAGALVLLGVLLHIITIDGDIDFMDRLRVALSPVFVPMLLLLPVALLLVRGGTTTRSRRHRRAGRPAPSCCSSRCWPRRSPCWRS